jgi:hypothetical protein
MKTRLIHSLLLQTVCGLLTALLLSCATQPAAKSAPLWVTNPQAAYPDADWLWAVETGSDRTTTENAALNALAQIFKVDVQGITRSNQALTNKVQRSGGKETSGTLQIRSLSQEVTTVAEVSGLIGVQRDIWTGSPNGLVYASARMNRREGAVRYRALIQENEALIGSLKESVNNITGTFEAYESLSLAASVADLTDNFYTILGVLEPGAARERPAYGNADAIRALMREQAALIAVQVEVVGDVDSRISKAFSSVFSKRGFRTSAESANKPYTLKADFKLEDVSFGDPQYKYTRFVLTAALMSKDGAELLSFSTNDREGHTILREAQQRAIRNAEAVITEGDFAKAFDAYLDSL